MRLLSTPLLSLFAVLSFVYQANAGLLMQRDGTTSGTITGSTASTSSTSTPTAALVETTVSGKATTIAVAVPTTDATSPASSTQTTIATGTATATGTSQTTNSDATATTGPAAPISSLLTCSRPSGPPICKPENNTVVHVGDTYYITWDPDRFATNATITILLNYANDSSHRAAWTSDGVPKQKSFLTVTMDEAWMQQFSNQTLEFALVSYTPVSDHAAAAIEGPTVFLSKAAPVHYPAPPHNKLPDNVSLLIGLPLGLGALLFVLLGLFFGMRKHRQIGLGSVMGRRKGYGAGKSKRQRLGKKGAIRLEEQAVLQNRGRARGDEITPAPAHHDQALADPMWPIHSGRGTANRESEVSLGSLVSEGEQGNAFRREIEKQRTGR